MWVSTQTKTISREKLLQLKKAHSLKNGFEVWKL